ncbi:MAG TPA: hypothetical protein VH143_02640 [Kofleriaceae bacterium]|nr:hypothetical protein [Kofleriaceae bacterium]
MAELTDAERELYRAPFDEFVATRDRLAGELKAGGDKAAATALAKRKRPSISAWAVNQLWWHAHADVEALFAVAARVRGGDLAASGAHRDALAKLRARAAALLGGSPAESVLRRVATTLSALAANGGFDPDVPGALTADRDPPGFEALAGLATAEPAPKHEPKPVLKLVPTLVVDDSHERAERERRDQHERAERAERLAKHQRELAQARARVTEASDAVDAAREALATAEATLEAAREDLAKLDA